MQLLAVILVNIDLSFCSILNMSYIHVLELVICPSILRNTLASLCQDRAKIKTLLSCRKALGTHTDNTLGGAIERQSNVLYVA